MNEVQKTMQTPGWAIIEQKFMNKIDKLMDFNVGDKTPDAISVQYIGRKKAKEILKDILRDLHKNINVEIKKESWK